MAEEHIEQSARTLGWVPLDEFRGDSDKWIEADQFVERGTTQLPIMRENIDRLMKKFDKATGEIASLKSDIQVMGDYNKKSDERAFKGAEKEYKAKILDLKKQIKQATKDGDEANLDAIEAEIDALEKPVEPAKKEDPKASSQQDPSYPEWAAENTWYGANVEMSAYADSIAPYISRVNPGLTGRPWFDKITEETKSKFPDNFENPNRKKAPTVGSGDDQPPTKKGGQKYADLPDDAKKQCDTLVKRWDWYKKEDFLKEYDWEG